MYRMVVSVNTIHVFSSIWSVIWWNTNSTHCHKNRVYMQSLWCEGKGAAVVTYRSWVNHSLVYDAAHRQFQCLAVSFLRINFHTIHKLLCVTTPLHFIYFFVCSCCQRLIWSIHPPWSISLMCKWSSRTVVVHDLHTSSINSISSTHLFYC